MSDKCSILNCGINLDLMDLIVDEPRILILLGGGQPVELDGYWGKLRQWGIEIKGQETRVEREGD